MYTSSFSFQIPQAPFRFIIIQKEPTIFQNGGAPTSREKGWNFPWCPLKSTWRIRSPWVEVWQIQDDIRSLYL